MKRRLIGLTIMIVFFWQAFSPAAAQEPSLFWERDGAYLRFESTPIQVCQITPDPLWTYITERGVDFLDDYIAIVFNQNFDPGDGFIQPAYPDCDIEIMLVRTFEFLPECLTQGEPLGCDIAYFTDEGRYVSHVYIRQDTIYRSAVWYHEIFHALGFVEHSTNPRDIMYGRVRWNVPEPSAAELASLVWLYEQPAIDWATKCPKVDQ